MKKHKKVTVELEFDQDFAGKDYSFKLSTSNTGSFQVELHGYSKVEISPKFFKELRKFLDEVEESIKGEQDGN